MKKSIAEETQLDVPVWWDCQWRRERCGKEECAMCGRINRQRRIHLAKGEDPDSVESIMEDVKDSFEEAAQLIQKGAEELGIDLSELEKEAESDTETLWNLPSTTTPLQEQLTEWRRSVSDITRKADAAGETWLSTEAGQDLLWYANTVLVKLRRQQDTVAELEAGEDVWIEAATYTQYVLEECVKYLDAAFTDLIAMPSGQKLELMFAYDAFKQCVPQIKLVYNPFMPRISR